MVKYETKSENNRLLNNIQSRSVQLEFTHVFFQRGQPLQSCMSFMSFSDTSNMASENLIEHVIFDDYFTPEEILLKLRRFREPIDLFLAIFRDAECKVCCLVITCPEALETAHNKCVSFSVLISRSLL